MWAYVEFAFLTKGISSTEKLVLLALAYHADKEGVAWPSKERLAECTNLTPMGVWKALRGLREKGLLEVEARPGTSNLYRLNLEDLKAKTGINEVYPPATGEGINEVYGGGGEGINQGNGGINEVYPRDKRGLPEPVIEPVINKPSSSPPYSPPQGEPRGMRDGDEEVHLGEGGPKAGVKLKGEKPFPSEGEASPSGQEASGEAASSLPSPGTDVLGVSTSFPGPQAEAVPRNGPVPVGQAVREALSGLKMSREEALAELAQRRRPAPPPQVPGGMVLALREAGLWERLSALRRHARDSRAWQEWLAGTLGALWGSATPDAFTQGVAEALDALARRPDVARPFGYVEAILRKALGREEAEPAKEAVSNGEAVEYSQEALEEFFRDGVPFLDGTLGIYDGLVGTGPGTKVVVRDPATDAVTLVPVAEALKRVKDRPLGHGRSPYLAEDPLYLLQQVAGGLSYGITGWVLERLWPPPATTRREAAIALAWRAATALDEEWRRVEEILGRDGELFPMEVHPGQLWYIPVPEERRSLVLSLVDAILDGPGEAYDPPEAGLPEEVVAGLIATGQWPD